jgi:hypothetical protein
VVRHLHAELVLLELMRPAELQASVPRHFDQVDAGADKPSRVAKPAKNRSACSRLSEVV